MDRRTSLMGPDFDAVILRALAGRKIPVLVDVDFGHTEPRLTLPVGGRATMDTDSCRITLHPHESHLGNVDQ